MLTIAQRIAQNKAASKMHNDQCFWETFFDELRGYIDVAAANAVTHERFYVSPNIADKIKVHSEILLNQLPINMTYNLYMFTDQAMSTAFRKFIDWIRAQQCTVVVTVEIEPDTEELTSFIYISAIEL